MKNYKLRNPSLSQDFAIVTIIILTSLSILSVWFTFLIQTDHQEHYNTRLYFSATRIQRILATELEYIERQLVNFHDDLKETEEISLEEIKSKIEKMHRQSSFVMGNTRNAFSWVSVDKKMLIHGEYGILEKPIDISNRYYKSDFPKDDGQILFGIPTTGATSGLRILPIGIAVSNKQGELLGILNYSFNLEGLLFKLERASMMPHAAFALIKEDNRTILQSACCSRLANAVDFKEILKTIPEQHSGLLTKQSLLDRKTPFSYFIRFNRYPLTLVLIYDSNISYIKLRNIWMTRISEFLIFAVLIFVCLYIIQRRIIKPLVSLAELSESIFQNKSKITIPAFGSKELQILANQIQKLSYYIDHEKKIKEELSSKTFALETAKKMAEQSEIAERISRIESERSRNDVKLAYEHLEDKVKERTLQLEEALKAKTEFLNNMSHEVRTPIHGVINFIDFLTEEWNNLNEEERFNLADKIKKNSHRLHSLVNNLLDLAKYSSSKMNFNFSLILISNIIKDVLEELEPLYLYRPEINVFIDIREDIKTEIDCERIKQLLRNLVANALKFTKEGNIVISVCKENIYINENKAGFKITVKDSGVGVPENELNEIFSAFSQSSRTKTRAGGTGLGLAICKEIVDNHHGVIWAENNPGGGASFCVILPIIQSPIILEDETESEHTEELLSSI